MKSAGRSCWRHNSGVHFIINDAPEGTRGKKSVSGFNLHNFEATPFRAGQAYRLMENDSSNFDVNRPVPNLMAPVTIDHFKDWNDDVIMLSSHGNTFGYFCPKQPRYNPDIDAREYPGRSEWLEPYMFISSDIHFDSVGLSEMFLSDPSIFADLTSHRTYPPLILIFKDSEDRNNAELGITPRFFEEHSGDMNGALVYFGTCRSLHEGSKNHDFWKVFERKGAAAFLGYTDFVHDVFATHMSRMLFREMITGKTLGDAMNVVRNSVENNPVYSD